MVIGLPGDRRDRDLIATFSASFPFVSEFVIHDLINRRGRGENEVPILLRARLPANVPSQIAPNQSEAVQLAWHRVQPGERLVIIADEVDDALHILESLSSHDEDAACVSPLAPVELMEERGHGSHAYAHRGW
jgi:cyanophycin synthetase